MPDKLPGRDKKLLGANVAIGESLCERGRYEEGIRYLEEALRPSATEKDRDLKFYELRAKNSLALCQIADGRQSDAMATLENVRAGLKEIEEEVGSLGKYIWLLERCDKRLTRLEAKAK